MLLLANGEGWPGVGRAARGLAAAEPVLDALIEGIALVERDPRVRTVGYGGWPNLVGEMECDGGVMEGRSRRVGAVAALHGDYSAVRLAREVMARLPHVLVVGDGAARFACECGLERHPDLHEDSAARWRRHFGADRPEALATLAWHGADPETVKDTVVILGLGAGGDMAAATSTSGWAWKYPGRVGDSPVPGAGFYADARFGAAACTHTGEMTLRCGTARLIVDSLARGDGLDQAVDRGADDLCSLSEGFLGTVVIQPSTFRVATGCWRSTVRARSITGSGGKGWLNRCGGNRTFGRAEPQRRPRQKTARFGKS